jgi:N-acetylglucosaminyldiphosphoundecaprenol N-acetyl-beta-D-mannosaminyltransferase
MTRRQGEKACVLGVDVSAINMSDALQELESWIATGSQGYVCITGAHGLIESQDDPVLRDIHNRAGLVTPDGMPLVWMSRALGHKRTERVYGPDLMRKMSALSARRGYRQFYYGGAEGVAERLSHTLTQDYPGLEVAGHFCPPFRLLTVAEDEEVVNRINQARPDIVWVGLSTPKQEYWMASHLIRIKAPVMIGVGAAFDFLSGLKSQAPAWMQKRGLEWSYRLATEPKRLWRRYLTIVPRFIALAGWQLLSARLLAQASCRIESGSGPPYKGERSR